MRNTPLHAAAFSGHERLVVQLLKAGAKPDAVDVANNQPLHRAVIEGHRDAVLALLQHCAPANAAGSERNTCLHFMALVRLDDLRMAELLLAYGARPSEVNRFGKTPFDLAIFHSQLFLAQRLQVALSDPGASRLSEALEQSRESASERRGSGL
eukprot:4004554-Prymnesium_polylepis.1